MRSFSWQYFALTGDVDAYMLYKDATRYYDQHDDFEQPMEEDGVEIDREG